MIVIPYVVLQVPTLLLVMVTFAASRRNVGGLNTYNYAYIIPGEVGCISQYKYSINIGPYCACIQCTSVVEVLRPHEHWCLFNIHDVMTSHVPPTQCLPKP